MDSHSQPRWHRPGQGKQPWQSRNRCSSTSGPIPNRPAMRTPSTATSSSNSLTAGLFLGLLRPSGRSFPLRGSPLVHAPAAGPPPVGEAEGRGYPGTPGRLSPNVGDAAWPGGLEHEGQYRYRWR
jgi:hypothetical protein